MSRLIQVLFSPKNLLKTNAIIGTTLMATGDIIAQELDMNNFFEKPIFGMMGLSSKSKETTRQYSADAAKFLDDTGNRLLTAATQALNDNSRDKRNSPISFLAGMFDSDTLKHIDLKQRGAMAAGGLYFGVAGHFWYQFLENRFKNKRRAILKKLLADGMAGPPFAAGLFAVIGACHGQSLMQSMEQLRSNIWLILAADWCFFVPLQTINFRYLPMKYRVLYVGFITLVYDTFLSHVINSSHKESSQIRSS